ncbi:nuclear RNA export factor 2-like, partial [Otolemur garnettii]|uniref:nuclear RNA export factor 2-like n=1 Tax=Otolemur garnettii TaxID=30611 RepID=UPI00064473A9
HDAGGYYSQEGKRGWYSFWDNSNRRDLRYELGGYGRLSSRRWVDDGNMEMTDVRENSRMRRTFHTFRQNRRRMNWQNGDQIRVTLWRDEKPPERASGSRRDRARGSWFKVTIPHGANYDKAWLVSSIQSHCSVSFTPVDLLSLNLCENKLYHLDGLSDIIDKTTDIKILNLSKNELKSACELAKVKALKLEELWLEGNPLCSTFSDKSAYISAIQDYFPKLLRLDGQELPSPIIVDIRVPELIKPSQESYKGPDTIKSLVLEFLKQYYSIYDYGNRQSLLSAYHDEACFSLTIPINSEDSASSSLCEYFKESRNLKMIKDPYLRRRLLKHTKCEIVDTLITLPKTQHDFNSFRVDMWFQTEKMLCFSINGVFKETEGEYQDSVLAFSRTFIATPGSNSNLCIVNDELFVRDASSQETQSAFSNPVTTLCSSPMAILSQEQQEMVQAFSTQSGMKPNWSQKCLEDNEWNYSKAGEIFTALQSQGKIPEEAFQRTP